ncbi:hypothetical protein [Myxococcus qinghaiensis]|uniref:hypothetical protein n=1 Tax=Myxococcus qinghaiensis TaxID=2906758 RepID=UPI0020A7F8C2|nr:hypothetical protein [Myxococcus qinghaiensis]MCP3164375.1 hypothetical protein [Myxococcus qinghaiensis]
MRLRRPALALSSTAALLFGACSHSPPVLECGPLRSHLDMCVEEFARGNLDRAADYCDLGLEFFPQNPELRAHRGLIALMRHDTAMAKRHLRQATQQSLAQATRLAPEDPLVWRDLGTVLMEQRRFREAEAAFQHCAHLREPPAECQTGREQSLRATEP